MEWKYIQSSINNKRRLKVEKFFERRGELLTALLYATILVTTYTVTLGQLA